MPIGLYLCGLSDDEQPYAGYATDFVRSCRKYHRWIPDEDGNLVSKLCIEYFTGLDTPLYRGPLNSGSPQYEALPVPKFAGLWVGDPPQWVRGSIADAEIICRDSACHCSYGQEVGLDIFFDCSCSAGEETDIPTYYGCSCSQGGQYFPYVGKSCSCSMGERVPVSYYTGSDCSCDSAVNFEDDEVRYRGEVCSYHCANANNKIIPDKFCSCSLGEQTFD